MALLLICACKMAVLNGSSELLFFNHLCMLQYSFLHFIGRKIEKDRQKWILTIRHINSQSPVWQWLTPVFSHWDITASSQCPCPLSRVHSLKDTKRKGPEGGAGPHIWTTTYSGRKYLKSVRRNDRRKGQPEPIKQSFRANVKLIM